MPSLQHVFAIGAEGERSVARHFLDEAWEDCFDRSAVFAAQRPDANDLMQLIFTSGTTGEPKGVMHTANTMFAKITPSAERMRLARNDVGFSPTPIAHRLGYLFGGPDALMLGGKVVLQDIWQPAIATSLIADERVTYCMGARHSSMISPTRTTFTGWTHPVCATSSLAEHQFRRRWSALPRRASVAR